MPRTSGKVKHAILLGSAVRVYVKPSLVGINTVSPAKKGRAVKTQIIRTSGVNRVSEKVIARNEDVAKAKPSSKCKGLSYDKFIVCLQSEMKKA